MERDVAAALTRADPTVALRFGTFDQLVAATVTQERLIAMLAAFFGGLALLLAGIGLYGIVAHAVRARQTEISLRMALGAPPAGIVRLVFRRVGVLIVAGLALGLVASLGAARFVAPVVVPGGGPRSGDVRRRGRCARCRRRAGRLAARAARARLDPAACSAKGRPTRRVRRRRGSAAPSQRSQSAGYPTREATFSSCGSMAPRLLTISNWPFFAWAIYMFMRT